MNRAPRFLGLSVGLVFSAMLGCGDRTGFILDERASVSSPLETSDHLDAAVDVFPAEDAGSDGAEPDDADSDGGATDDDAEATDDAGSGAGSGGGASGAEGILCDPVLGPIPANDPNGGADHACTPYYPHCVELGDMWLCCRGPGPYDGPTGTCL